MTGRSARPPTPRRRAAASCSRIGALAPPPDPLPTLPPRGEGTGRGMLTSTRTTRIEWCHCDPLGIIFYPRYYEMFDISTTVLIEQALGLSKAEYLKAYD